jgi:hypothetical protein
MYTIASRQIPGSNDLAGDAVETIAACHSVRKFKVRIPVLFHMLNIHQWRFAQNAVNRTRYCRVVGWAH